MKNNQNYLRSITLLYVEDNAETKDEIFYFLNDKVKQLYVAQDGVEALEIYESHRPDIILTDISMPNMNGIELSMAIRQQNAHAPIIITSAHTDAKYLTDAIEIGVSNFLLKPLSLQKLFDSLNTCAKNIAIEQENREIRTVLSQYESIVQEKEIISKTDANGIITYVNEPFIKISGYSKEELLGKSHSVVRHVDASYTNSKELWHCIRDKKQLWRGTFKNQNAQGQAYYVDATIKPILDKEGNIKEYIGICHDITDLKQSKLKLKAQNQQHSHHLSMALSNLEQYEKGINECNIFSRTDAQGKITYINESFIKISGYTKEELIGQTHSLIRHEEVPHSYFSELWETIKEGKLWKGQMKNRHKNGDVYYLDAVITPIFDNSGNITEYMSISHDITPMVKLNEELEATQREIITRMGEVAEVRSQETANHVKRVAEYSRLLARLYGLSQKEINMIFVASPMHDIGKVGIADAILNKPAKLDQTERETMQEHCIIGHNMLKNSDKEILQAAAIVAYEHHEKWDGSGYPRGLKGEEIHIFGRITAIADVFDAWGSKRCYKEAWGMETIMDFFKEERGKHFEPKLVDLFFENLEDFLEIRNRYVD